MDELNLLALAADCAECDMPANEQYELLSSLYPDLTDSDIFYTMDFVRGIETLLDAE